MKISERERVTASSFLLTVPFRTDIVFVDAKSLTGNYPAGKGFRGSYMHVNIHDFRWPREPADCTVSDDKVEIITKPHTDLWQRTYYHFRNDNASVFQMETEEKFFSFTVKTAFAESHHRSGRRMRTFRRKSVCCGIPMCRVLCTLSNQLSKDILAQKVDGSRPITIELNDGQLCFNN